MKPSFVMHFRWNKAATENVRRYYFSWLQRIPQIPRIHDWPASRFSG
ncbi:MAG: hypothetical protein ACE1ZS_01950 [Candidatus Poribacteria bacterium]